MERVSKEKETWFFRQVGLGRGTAQLLRGGVEMKALIKILLTIFLAAAFALPAAAFGEVYTGGAHAPAGQMVGNAPPLEQPLVPEGAFAVQLVQILNLGRTEDEAQAETMLSAVGIEPKNGWIAQYPVTPPILIEIEEGVARAADAGKLKMGKDRALRAVADLKNNLGLNITPGSAPAGQPVSPQKPGNGVIYKYTDKYGIINFTDRYESIPQEYRAKMETIRQTPPLQVSETPVSAADPGHAAGSPEGQMAAPNPPAEVVNQYYYDPGPPVVTYYVPPPDYYYLYSWVPYPFWWSGFYFGGFFILNDFHRHVSFHGRKGFVSNHYSYSGHRQFYTVNPASRGRISMPAQSSPASKSPAARSGAQKIYGSAQNRNTPSAVSKAPGVKNRAPTSPTRAAIPARPGRGQAYGQAVQAGKTVTPSPGAIRGRKVSPPAPIVTPSSRVPAPTPSTPPVAKGRSYSPPSFSSEVYRPPSTTSRGSWGWFRGRGASAPSSSLGGGRGGFGGRR